MVICLQQGADLHMAQLMQLPLTVSCFSKVQIGLRPTLIWYRPTRVVPEKGPLNVCMCVCVCVSYDTTSSLNVRSKAGTSQLNLPHGTAN